MTTLLEQALEVVRRMPPASQDVIAKLLLDISEGDARAPEDIPAEHLADVMAGLAEADRGEFATDEEVAAAWQRFER